MNKGKAYIIGAGPGDFELLTLKAKRVIENADCIIYDRLISPNILDLPKSTAELIYLGKENTEGGLIQDEINQTLVKKCLEGKNVARVKGGDPFVFGRGGEEIDALVENGISFEVIPGITSSISVPAYAGIPVTHRGLARSFHIFTGHTMENGKWHNFENIAKLEGTLVFLMGVKNLDLIVSDLIKNGKSSKTPVAIIEKGATRKQRVSVGTLENILEIAKKNKVKSPAITIIGEVVNLRETFSWFEPKESSKKILITRDKKQAKEMSKLVLNKGGIPIELPFIEIEELKISTENLKKYSAILFNSPNGVKSFFKNIEDMRILANIKIGAVGAKTKEVLESLKIVPDFMPEEYMVDRLAEEVVKFTNRNDNILIVTSDISPADLDKYNSLYERNYEKIVAYNTKKIKVAKDEINEKLEDIDIITFLSSSTVEAFYESINGDLKVLENKKIASIGPMTSETMRKYGIKVDYEAKKYTAEGLLDVIF
ncbi:uroporphyrinogen-III C-methyltransferase [Fusobacterium gastrosuis]|uniref:uroporphyrinogen-III C-methyltransferase n=1 Tax=Fusobacterium gastrosuis TaxID=1755100 RepID=UPI0029745F88|nr:uroporphyrinogen-III C-methyltransferase [Fusobacteriaceae bacterium]MDY5712569.1 uroporphyrinogen-III C-methyltransferase [Fusobacterium gastrosuis]